MHDAVKDELEIRNLLARLAQEADMCPDERLAVDYVGLYTHDAVWDAGEALQRGHEEILAGARGRRASGIQGPGTNRRHILTTSRIQLRGDEATHDGYYLMVEALPEPKIFAAGHYHDTLRRTNDGWKLAYRKITRG